jgi:predicted transcriptional regulator
MPDFSDLTDLQLMIMSVLWDEREATIGAIHDLVGARSNVTRKTIATLLTRLEARRLVAHRVDGRESVYRAQVARRRVLRSRVTGLLRAVFPGRSLGDGVRALDPAEVRQGDVRKLVALLRRLERDV